MIHIPLGLGKLHEYGLHDWGYKAEPEEAVAGRGIQARRGRVLGGSSAINVMAYSRGAAGDYDRWARNGATGWSYADVLPYFKRNETWVGGESETRGGSGPLGVEWERNRDPMFDAWREAALGLGYPATEDLNSASGEGFGRAQYTIRNGRRASAATAFLKPALRRANLVLRTKAHATQIILSGTRAVGVVYQQNGQRIQAYATREVILSGGAFNTPQLLMLSGIGPADHLRNIGIDPVADLPVGRNLQDHLAVLIMFTRPTPGPFHALMRMDRMALAMLRAYLFGTGPGIIIPSALYGFVKTRADLEVPDLEFMFRGVPADLNLWFPGIVKAYEDGFGIRPCLLHPESRGHVQLRSANPFDPVRIRFNFFDEPRDLENLRAAFKRGREIARRPEIARFCGVEKTPGENVKTDAEIDDYIRRTMITVNHPAGTCPMGSRDAVLDSRLRVLGFEGLRVVDASAMPDLVSGHINACVLMMAEKAAAMISEDPN